jgi:hypothetical protein
MAIEPPIGGDPIALSPATYQAHDEAVQYVKTMSRTRDPVLRDTRSPGIRASAWALLAAGATITAGSGLSLGSGIVKLCDRDGGVPDGAEDITVANAGASLSGGPTGRIVRLAWTDDEWAVSCNGGS